MIVRGNDLSRIIRRTMIVRENDLSQIIKRTIIARGNDENPLSDYQENDDRAGEMTKGNSSSCRDDERGGPLRDFTKEEARRDY
jgi:hypothetical protein